MQTTDYLAPNQKAEITLKHIDLAITLAAELKAQAAAALNAHITPPKLDANGFYNPLDVSDSDDVEPDAELLARYNAATMLWSLAIDARNAALDNLPID